MENINILPLLLGETELNDDYRSYRNTLWLDMSWFARILHVLKQVSLFLCLKLEIYGFNS